LHHVAQIASLPHYLIGLVRKKQALQQRFFEALSQGDATFGTRPIDLQASCVHAKHM
jgi:hypothetical protein